MEMKEKQSQGKSPLQDKIVLAVDDEPDILESIEEELDMVMLHKATDYETANQYLISYTYDLVVLDIMGVNGFDLLRKCVSLGFPTVMLTAHAVTPEALKKSIKLGALSFLPKEKISELQPFLEDIIAHRGEPIWHKLFDKLGGYFNRRFGADWKEKDEFFRDFEREMKTSGESERSERDAYVSREGKNDP